MTTVRVGVGGRLESGEDMVSERNKRSEVIGSGVTKSVKMLLSWSVLLWSDKLDNMLVQQRPMLHSSSST